MPTVNRIVESDYDKKMALRFLESRPVPFTLSVADGKHRSISQNKLQRKWMIEISQQLGDMTPEEARGYCKLTIGIPILRAENEAFCETYDRLLKPRTYEEKLAFMMEPIDLPVTRIMTTRQLTQYLDGIVRHFGQQGVILTMPDDLRYASYTGDAPSSPATEAEDRSAGPASPEPAATSADSAAGSSDSAAVPPADMEPAGNPDAPTTAAAGSSSLFAFTFTAGELQHLIDYSSKGLDEAASSNDQQAKEHYIETMRVNYLDAIESKDGRAAIKAIGKAFSAVIAGKRTRDQAAAYIATELLNCDPGKLEGRR